MIGDKLHAKIQHFTLVLQGYADRIWYPPMIGLLAALDNLIVIVPTDGILISSSMITPKRWFTLAVTIAIGSTLGALLLAYLVELHGLPWILKFYPTIDETTTWAWSVKFFEQYGLLLVFAVAVTPLMQQPAVILASLANTPLLQLAAVILIGRLIKYLVMSYLGSHAPRMLKRLWGLKGDLKDAGVKLP